MEANILNSLLRERLMAMLSGFFGALATLLAMMGLFGVMSNSVARAAPENRLAHCARRAAAEYFGHGAWRSRRDASHRFVHRRDTSFGRRQNSHRHAVQRQPYDPLTIALSATALRCRGYSSPVIYRRAARGTAPNPHGALRDE